ncbi:MAG: hypothetical protein N3I35_02495 [Clostridia bacterium]|nr:hypothetical protein [Clostridia bacterium]
MKGSDKMDYLMDRLIRETVKFLEICQEQTLEGKISVRDYNSLTTSKFKFINDILEEEKRPLFFDKNFCKRLYRLYMNGYFLNSLDKRIVGN